MTSAQAGLRQRLRAATALTVMALWASPIQITQAEERAVKSLDTFEDISNWSTTTSDQVTATLRQSEGTTGKALCLAYDFHGVSGYAVAHRKLPLDYPGNFEFALKLRGDAPANNLEFKLPDSSGENVWWATKPNYTPPSDWTALKIKRRQISFAWGPSSDKTLRHTETFEFTVSAGKGGGKGELCFDELTMRELPPEDAPLPPVTAAAAKGVAAYALDGNAQTAWSAPAGPQQLTLDYGRSREFGGLSLRWAPGLQATRYRVFVSDDARQWREVRSVSEGNGGEDLLSLPGSEARYLRLDLERGAGREYALQEIVTEPLAFSATPNDFIKAVAARARRGSFPRGFSGEQPYWTVVGVDGGPEPGLLGEDGAIESAKGGFSVEPFIVEGKRVISWADVRSSQSLAEGYLPIPSVDWKHDAASLRVTAFATGDGSASNLVARYRIANPTKTRRKLRLALVVRPFQVNPPSQFLNTVGGLAPIHQIGLTANGVSVDGKPRVASLQPATALVATSFDAGMAQTHLLHAGTADAVRLNDATGLASGAMLFDFDLAPGESREVDLWLPMHAGSAAPPPGFNPQVAQTAAAARWRESLNRVRLEVPTAGQPLVGTLRTALANMLISRAGPRLQPGTRSYARAWIRDGAMISEGLLRLGHGDVAEDFLRWYAPYQFANGKVPCCVDDRGSDPVPENDSQGEFIYTVAEIYRHGGDKKLLAEMWPRVQSAVRFMDELRRSERTDAQKREHPELYGLMPASISHEGYSAKPMHSYWDDFWALRGYKDAVQIANWLDHADEAKAMAASRDQFATDLYATLDASAAKHGIDFIPGAAELGDFDATSTTIALAPGGEQERLNQTRLHNTFERYWKEFEQRRDGSKAWDYYTPYELRTVGAFVRLGWPERAMSALDFFMKDRQPAGWNQWAEVVGHEPRKPFFVGDLPHAWVASDYVRSLLDMFAYERESDHALVLAAGIPEKWLDGKGIRVRGLRTPYGELSYSLKREEEGYRLSIEGGLRLPPGGFLLRGMHISPPALPYSERYTPMESPAK